MSSVEEIVLRIKQGEDLKGELYKAIYKLLYHICKRKALYIDDLKGFDIEDLFQSAWIGVERAIKDFDESKGYKFVTYLKFHVKNTINELLGIRNGKKSISALSLDEPLSEDEDICLLDTIEDVKAAEVFDNIEKCDYYDILYSEIDKLPNGEQSVLKRYYFSNESLNDIAESTGGELADIRLYKSRALRHIRKNPKINIYRYDDFICWHVGVESFNNSWTSSVERSVIKLDEFKNDFK